MRIGLIAPPWAPVPAADGTSSIIDLLARAWTAAGHEVVLCATGDSTCAVDRRWVHRRSLPEQRGQALPETRHASFAYEALFDCDIVHDHTVVGPLVAPSIAGWPKPRGLPIVSTCHGPFDDEQTAAFRAIAHRASVVAISADQASRSRGVSIRRVIHHGIDAADHPVGAGDGDYLLFLGRMSPSQGVHRAIEIARRAGHQLFIAASCRAPEERQYFDEAVRPLLGHGVEYLGEVERVEKLELLGAARALLHPISWPEPFSLGMLEAMACGTPVLTSAEGAATEIVEHGRTGFVERTESDLVLAIDRIDELSRDACRRAVEGYFSSARMAAEHIRLFESILREGQIIDLSRRTPPPETAEARRQRLVVLSH
jgi:glycosyltransferase involved in cell wall biosynthesis